MPKILPLGFALIALSACEALTKFSDEGHSDGRYAGNSYSSSYGGYNSTGIIYPDARGNELGYQALGRDLSDGSVEIYSLGGPEFVTAQQQRPAPLDSYPVNSAIPSTDSSVIVYELEGRPPITQTVTETRMILPPPAGANPYPSPFVQTNDPSTLIATVPPRQDIVVERTVTTVPNTTVSAPTMTGPR